MAIGELIPPGQRFGPCADSCEHTICAFTRALAEVRCKICGQPIGYGQPFEYEGPSLATSVLRHQECAASVKPKVYEFPAATHMLQALMKYHEKNVPLYWMIIYIYVPLAHELANHTASEKFIRETLDKVIGEARSTCPGGAMAGSWLTGVHHQRLFDTLRVHVGYEVTVK